MSKAKQAFSIFVLFGSLAASAATGFPRAYYDGPMARGMDIIDWTVTTLGTDHFGAIGGAVFFGVLGIFFTGLALVGPRGQNGAISF